MKRKVFFVSDRTGITVEALGESLLTQFPGIDFERIRIPFVDTEAAAELAAQQISAASEADGIEPIVFSTLTDPAIRSVIRARATFDFDLFGAFIEPLETALEQHSTHSVGRKHGIVDVHAYERRLNALNYTLSHDDGLRINDLTDADIVLLGVSRSGKTPTCLYLGMHYNLRAANYPITEDEYDEASLPPILEAVRERLYGLTIVPEQLSRIRKQRRPDGIYASLGQCRAEVARTEALFRREGIPWLDTTTISIEEIAATIVRDTNLRAARR
ncbi:MAG: kinase/pyrophosphorylase [Gammaproteobacteria bacterium]|nr:kinase/pyrophosphorylase [Gammaproteobacteria bacterium]